MPEAKAYLVLGFWVAVMLGHHLWQKHLSFRQREAFWGWFWMLFIALFICSSAYSLFVYGHFNLPSFEYDGR